MLNDAATRAVQNILREEGYASDMVRTSWSNDMNALLKDAQIELSMEVCAAGMGLSTNDAAAGDAQIKPSKEECALDMGQR